VQHADPDPAVLAHYLALSESGQPADEDLNCPICAAVAELLELAERIRALPPVEPDRAWLDASRRRLLERFQARD
jgi:hypothetical protein